MVMSHGLKDLKDFKENDHIDRLQCLFYILIISIILTIVTYISLSFYYDYFSIPLLIIFILPLSIFVIFCTYREILKDEELNKNQELIKFNSKQII